MAQSLDNPTALDDHVLLYLLYKIPFVFNQEEDYFDQKPTHTHTHIQSYTSHAVHTNQHTHPHASSKPKRKRTDQKTNRLNTFLS